MNDVPERIIWAAAASSIVTGVALALLLAGSGATADEGDGNGAADVQAVVSAVEPPDWPVVSEPQQQQTLSMLGSQVQAGQKKRLRLALSESFAGVVVSTPVNVIRGNSAGPVACFVAGIHGDEIVGIEVVRRLTDYVQPTALRGTIIGLPIANPLGFRRTSRYLPDRRDLNRYFPGRQAGSSASRIAYRLFDGVIRHCTVLTDFHSGSFHRSNLPQVRANLGNPQLLGLASWFRTPVVVHSPARLGTLRRAAADAGILSVLYEAGEPMRFDEASVEGGVMGSLRLLQSLGMIDPGVATGEEPDAFRGSHWVRAEQGGIFLGDRKLGDWVAAGDVLATVTDPFTNERDVIRATSRGRVIGRALDQVVMPGFALYHVGTPESPLPVLVESEAASQTEELAGPELEERPE